MNFLLPLLQGMISLGGAARAFSGVRRASTALATARRAQTAAGGWRAALGRRRAPRFVRNMAAAAIRSRRTPRFVKAAYRHARRSPIIQGAANWARGGQATPPPTNTPPTPTGTPTPPPPGTAGFAGPPPPVQPQINYSAMMGQAGNPNAKEQAQSDANDQAQRQTQQNNQQFAQQQLATARQEFVRAVTGGVTALLTLPGATRKLGEAFTETRRTLGEANGHIRASFALLDIQQHQRNIRTGQKVQGSTGALTDSLETSRQSWESVDQTMTSIGNQIGIITNYTSAFFGQVTEILTVISGLKWLADKIEKNTRKLPPKSLPQQELVALLRRGGLVDFWNRPPIPPMK